MSDLQRLLYVLIAAGAPINKVTTSDGIVTVELPNNVIFEDGKATGYYNYDE